MHIIIIIIIILSNFTNRQIRSGNVFGHICPSVMLLLLKTLS